MPVKIGFCLVALPGSKNVNKFSGDAPAELVFASFTSGEFPVISIPASSQNPQILQDLECRPEEPVIGREEYVASVKKAKQQFSAQFSKVVLARNEVIPVPEGFDPFTLFDRICEQYPHAFRYILWHPDTGLWIGASPELLVESDGNNVRTMALAGTLFQPDREWTRKEYTEHEIVVQYIAEKLKEIPVSNLQVESTGTVNAGNIKHLKTDITATIEPSRINDVVARLHPTPAIAGFPTDVALNFIQKNESLHRSYYAGYVGIRDKNSLKFYVNLRCMRVYKDALEFYAGAGITSDSDPELEWEETERKIATLKDLII